MARLATKWEKTLETHITEGDSIKNIQSTPTTQLATNSLIVKFIRDETLMAHMHMACCLISLIFKKNSNQNNEMQLFHIRAYHQIR